MKSIVLCGDDELPWVEVLEAMKFLSEAEEAAQSSNPIAPIIRLFSEIYTSHHSSRNVRLDELLYLSVRRGASDPRDIVYGLYGLLRQPEIDNLKPDYSASMELAYQKAMIHIIEDRKDLDFLVHAARQQSSPQSSLPSWCVDFSSKRNRLDPTELEQLHHRYSTRYQGASSGSSLSYLKHDLQNNKIELYGTRVGSITITKQVATTQPLRRTKKTSDLVKLLSDVHSLTDFVRETQATGMSRSDRKRLPSALLKEAGDVWKLAMNGRNLETISQKDAHTIPSYKSLVHLWEQFEEQPTHQEDFELLRHMYNRLIDTNIGNLTVFATYNGYIGSSYTDVQPHDLIVILFGCPLPLVIRRKDLESHTLIDAVYVHGIMGGEFFLSKNYRPATKFVLS